MTNKNQEIQDKIDKLNETIRTSEKKIDDARSRCAAVLQVEWERIERTRILLDGWFKALESREEEK